MCQIETLGERIRKLRKQQKLTLEGLAGTGLTKGMLSLIENNKANPSIESLNYIAERLGVDVSELLEEVSMKELREVLEKAEKLYHTGIDALTDEYEQLISLVKPFVPYLTQGYESARLLEMYSRCLLHHGKKDGWEDLADRAAHIYEELNIIPRRANIGIFRALVVFTEHDYAQSLNILILERSAIEAKNSYIDPMTRIDLDYHEAALHFAVGDSDSALRVMESAIEFSKKESVFYNIDSLYILATAHSMMTHNEEKTKYYLKKIQQYNAFAEDIKTTFITMFFEVHQLNSYEKSYEDALFILNRYFEDHELNNYNSAFFNLEKGKSLHGMNQFEEALDILEKVEISDHVHHPFDLSVLYEADAYAARCHLALGNKIEAWRAIDKAVENITPMPHTPYKEFILETYEFIRE